MGRGTSIAGRKVSPTESNADFYETPREAVVGLLKKEDFGGVVFQPLVWEPCCGNGAISKVLDEHGIPHLSTDWRKTEFTGGYIDVLKRPEFVVEHVITNPPYSIAEQVIRACLDVATGKIAMLLKLSFLESESRRKFFEEHPPTRIYVFCKRLTMYPAGTAPPKNGGTIAFAWFIWEKGFQGKPTIGWI